MRCNKKLCSEIQLCWNSQTLTRKKNPVSIKNTGIIHYNKIKYSVLQTDWRNMSTLNSNSKERIFAFDAAKAIGIFFIVIGHVFHDQGIYAQYVYSFHVPLFFFLTGVTFSRGKNGFWKFLIQKLTRLLVPFYIFAAVSWGVYAILGKFVSSFAEKAIDSSVSTIIIGTLKGYCAANTPLWFLPCLFLELLFLYAITFIIDRIASKRRLSYALFGVSIIAAIVIQYVIYKFSLFPTKAPIFKADVSVAMLPFSLSGVLFSKFAAQNQKTLRKPYIFILSLLCVAAGGFSALKLNVLVGYQSSEYGRILIFYLSAFMSVLGFTLLCFFIPKLKVISYIGSNTMPILLMHKFPVVFFHTLCPFISERLADKSLFWSAIAALLSIGLCLLVALPIHKIVPFVLGEKMPPRKRSKS